MPIETLRHTLMILAAAALFAAITPKARANVVANGGFESGTASWVITGGANGESAFSQSGTAAGVDDYEGNNFLQYTGNEGEGVYDGATVSQVVAVDTAFDYYRLGFALVRGGAVATQHMRVTLTSDGGSLGDVFDQTYELTGADGVWSLYTEVVSPTTASMTLAFNDASTNSVGTTVGVDAVSLTAIPEPASLTMLAVMGAATLRRRRR